MIKALDTAKNMPWFGSGRPRWTCARGCGWLESELTPSPARRN